MSDVLDSLHLFEAARKVPESTEQAILVAQDAALPLPDDVEAVVMVADGAPRWSADVAAAIAGSRSRVPIVVIGSQFELPQFCSDDTLVMEIQVAAGSPTVLVSAGRSGAGENVGIGNVVAHPRVAAVALCASLLSIIDRAGVGDSLSDELDRAVSQLHHRRNLLFPPDSATSTSDAIRLSRRIGRLFPLVYGEGDVGRLAALWWKHQINVNAKAPAYAGSLPAVGYDEIAGFGQHGDVTRQVMCSVLLRHDYEHASADASFAVLDDVLVESMAAVHHASAAGSGPLAQLLDLAYLGDVVSLHMAANEGIDPGPAPALLDSAAAGLQ